MSRNNIHGNSTEIFSARSEKKQVANMKGSPGMFHILWPLVSSFTQTFIKQQTLC